MHRDFYHQQLNPTAIVAAQGWVKTADGKILLIAQAPKATPSAATTSHTFIAQNQSALSLEQQARNYYYQGACTSQKTYPR